MNVDIEPENCTTQQPRRHDLNFRHLENLKSLTLEFYVRRGISRPAERVFACQERLSSLELVVMWFVSIDTKLKAVLKI
jgi:hypothetical protein